MPPSIFLTLCDLCNAFDRLLHDLEPGVVRDHLERLVQRLDDVTEHTIGVECHSAPAEEE